MPLLSSGIATPFNHSHHSSQRKSDFAWRHLRFAYIYFDVDSEQEAGEHDGIMMMDLLCIMHASHISQLTCAAVRYPEVSIFSLCRYLNFSAIFFFFLLSLVFLRNGTNIIILRVVFGFIDPNSERHWQSYKCIMKKRIFAPSLHTWEFWLLGHCPHSSQPQPQQGSIEKVDFFVRTLPNVSAAHTCRVPCEISTDHMFPFSMKHSSASAIRFFSSAIIYVLFSDNSIFKPLSSNMFIPMWRMSPAQTCKLVPNTTNDTRTTDIQAIESPRHSLTIPAFHALNKYLYLLCARWWWCWVGCRVDRIHDTRKCKGGFLIILTFECYFPI